MSIASARMLCTGGHMVPRFQIRRCAQYDAAVADGTGAALLSKWRQDSEGCTNWGHGTGLSGPSEQAI